MVYNSNDIQKIIPHRYPFLLVDQIDSIGEDGTSIVGHKCVSANEMQFLGHFRSASDAGRAHRGGAGADRLRASALP